MTISVESIKRSLLPGDGLYVEGDDASVYSTDDGKVLGIELQLLSSLLCQNFHFNVLPTLLSVGLIFKLVHLKAP